MAKYEPRLIVEYKKNIVPKLMKRFSYQNVMQVPRFEKIVVNLGVGEAIQDSKLIDKSSEDLQVISGQKPLITKAKKAISNFKIREGNKIGCKVTLRRWRMYEFIDRLINIDIPRIRDFRGLSDRSFDGRGNYTMGILEHIVFTEIDIDKIDEIHGMDITLVTSTDDTNAAKDLFTELGLPFSNRKKEEE